MTRAIALATSGCGPGNVQRGSADTGSVRATSAASAFAELNARSRQVDALKTPFAHYLFYRDHYGHSAGVVRGFLAQVPASTEAELGARKRALLHYPQGAPILRGTVAALPEPIEFRTI